MNRDILLGFALLGIFGAALLLLTQPRSRVRPRIDESQRGPVIQRSFAPRRDAVEEASWESFPASDPPGWTGSGL